MNYIQQIKDELRKDIGSGEAMLNAYALLVLVKGEDVTLEDVHDAWSVAKNTHMPDHRSLIPFDELSHEVQMKDEPYANAIKRVAREIAR